MKTPKLLLALMLLHSPLMARAGILAGPITNPANGHLYYLLTQNTWTASEAEALTLGGHLVTVNDAEEDQWVFNTFSTYGGRNRQLWIGFNAAQEPGQFRWSSAQPITYVNWAPGEPNFISQEHYVFVYSPGIPQPAGKWNNEYDRLFFDSWGESGGFYGVVEIDLPLVDVQVASVAISWRSETNKLYQVQYATEVAPTNWFNLGSPVQGTGTNSVVFDSVLDQPPRLYRVIVLHEGDPGGNKVLVLGGSGDYVSVPDAPELRLSAGDFSLMAWVWLNSHHPSQNSAILTKREAGSGRGWIWYIAATGAVPESRRLVFLVSEGADPRVVSDIEITINQWHQVALVYRSAQGTAEIFIDGLSHGSASVPQPLDSASPLHLGSDTKANPYFFNGQMDEVSLWGRALGPEEIPTWGIAHSPERSRAWSVTGILRMAARAI